MENFSNCLNNYYDLWVFITAIASFIMAIGVLVALFSYLNGKKSHYLSTIESCSKEFRMYMRLLQNGSSQSTLRRDMLGLFHKQLFYIRNNYVPVNIKIEWLKTMHFILRENVLENKAPIETSFNGIFDKKDWETSFDRVRWFINTSEKESREGKVKEEPKVLRYYKRNYFTWYQRPFLRFNKQWEKAFWKDKVTNATKAE